MSSIVLALETSGSIGSVALAVDGAVVARRFLDERGRHAAVLPEAIAAVLASASVAPKEVTAVAVGSGPGSFTGVRVAGAAANGFAHAVGCPVTPVSSLAAAAMTGSALPPGSGLWPEGESVEMVSLRVIFDARGDRVFTGVYERRAGELTVVEEPRFARLGEILSAPGVRAVAGDAAARHRESLAESGFEILDAPEGVPTADGVLSAMACGVARAPVPAGGWHPDYLRETSAVRERGRGPG